MKFHIQLSSTKIVITMHSNVRWFKVNFLIKNHTNTTNEIDNNDDLKTII